MTIKKAKMTLLKSHTLIHYLYIVTIAVFLANCKEGTNSQNYSFEDYFPLSIEQNIFFAQIAISEEELSHGLMFRNSLDKNHGMLFAFDTPRGMSFWMKNVPIPLDIGYFDSDGRLIEIRQLYPYDEKPVFSKSHTIQYALEMNQGWYHLNNIKTGNYINLKKVLKYIQLRKNSPNFKD